MTEDEHACRSGAAWADGCLELCSCQREQFCTERYSSCYQCFLDRLAEYSSCVYCGQWHSPEFDTCFECRRQGRDEAAGALKIVILARDGFTCRYCGIREGEEQVDPRLIRPRCPPRCSVEHNHQRPCKPACGRRHGHRGPDDPRVCQPGCIKEHAHLAKDDDGVRAAKLHIDHIRPCSKDGTADPWNLQVLCGVCNIAKGNDWWAGSRHHASRRLTMAAYLTYLWGHLTADQQEDLACDAKFEGLTYAQAVQLVTGDYIQRVRRCRRRPPPGAPEPRVEDVPEEWAFLDLPAPIR